MRLPTSMKKYQLVFHIAVQELFQYRFNFFAGVFKYTFAILIYALIWQVVNQQSGEEFFSEGGVLLYFALASVLFDFSNFHLVALEEEIKLGYISKYLTRPISVFWFYFWTQAATIGIRAGLRLLILSPVFFILFPSPGPTLAQLLMFVTFAICAYLFSFVFFFTLSTFVFWFHEVYAIRWMWMSILRVLSGIWIPLFLLPAAVVSVLQLLPFAHLVYTPIQVVLGKLPVVDALQPLVILLLWTALFVVVSRLVWRKAITAYESTGI